MPLLGYLTDTSAIWHLLRDAEARLRWTGPIESGLLKICEPTRAEFLRSARSASHRDELAEDLDDLFGLAAVPKGAWSWVDTAQYKLTQKGQHRGSGPIDLLVCATAVHHGLTVLHVDNDFAAIVAGVIGEPRQHDIRAVDPRL